MASVPELTRSQVAQLITRGHLLVLHRRTVYRLNGWASKHPGGSLAILHFVGRDAVGELEAYHPQDTLKRMPAFAVAQVTQGWSDEAGWAPLVPPVQLSKGWERLPEDVWASVESFQDGLKALADPNTPHPAQLPLLTVQDLEPDPPASKSLDPIQQHQMQLDYRKLHDELIRDGFYNPTPLSNYRADFMRYLLFFALAMAFYVKGSLTWHYMVSAFFLGCFKHQLTFFVHDAGHVGITGSYFWDRILGIAVADFMGGLSVGWWCDNHNIHHVVTNHTDHDPDIQHMPFFAISTNFFKSPYSTYYKRTLVYDAAARFFISIQHNVYYLILAFGRPNLFVNSYVYLFTKAKPGLFRTLELTGCAFFWTWFTLLLRALPTPGVRIAYVLVCFITTSPLHVQIVLSHFAQSTDDLGPYESFPYRQLRTTMDVDCPEWLDFLHGGLHMQVSHHLFPRIPRHRLREVNTRVRAFAERHKDKGMRYESWEFVEGNKKVLSTLQHVARQVGVLVEVAKSRPDLAGPH